ncbi:CNH-domain-containing protein [Neolentinus lepideus HHB14362 ss-1]|uniref:CNH-domain-containing protein n=1 Tax=Neolentinus lepideus HHB14362 ss-1 TaxID=1314782 RepID=A0A165UC18_9AGAM|nr:CNH-domain-containing protein [Neolentinus lepideus HHB14362 ss-1]
MDRPMGPRQPADKRNVAYESIFGRPSPSHHQTVPSAPYGEYSQSAYTSAQYLQPNGSHQVYQYQSQLARSPSYVSGYAPTQSYSVQPATGPPSAYRQSYYQPSPSQPQQYSQYAEYPYNGASGYAQPRSLAPPSVHSRARSIASSSHSRGVIAPQPDEPPDANLEALQRAGLTPAQAYQAQVYMYGPLAQQGNPNRYTYPPAQSDGTAGVQDGVSPEGIPRIPVTIETDDGRLGIDFADGSTEESSTELPWARSDRTAVPSSIHSQVQQGPIPSSSSRPYPLQLDTALKAAPSRPVDSSPASSTLVEPSEQHESVTFTTSSRRSSDSTRTMPGPAYRRERTNQDRARSMSAAMTPQVRAMLENGSARSSRPPIPPIPGPAGAGRNSPTNHRGHGHRRTPIIYPALLSKVAQAFRDRTQVSDRVKDGLTYKDAFDGREAVDKIAYIIKTTDRNLALLLGRALDAQKFFHDVTYDHRLRDNPNELYQFQSKLPSPFTSGELANVTENGVPEDGNANGKVPERNGADIINADNRMRTNGDASPPPASPTTPLPGTPQTRPLSNSESSDEAPLPSGVFTLLTDCYSPTCSRDQLCYSIACPRRLEQQARLNMKPQPGLKKQISKESLGDLVEPGTLWVHSVPKEVVDSVTDIEKKRQEAINEVIYTERDFVRDMEYLRDVWINPLKSSDVIPEHRRTDFLEQVFWNIHDIIAVNTRLRDALNKRQKSYAVVERIGDILLDAVPHFSPFVSYGAHQLYGKYEFEKEKGSNPAFAVFVEQTERLPESRKLELNGYLTKPTTRLARYPLLLEAVLKHTPEDNPDKTTLPQVIALVKEFLSKVNVESGRTENRFNLLQLDQQLVFRPGEEVDLRLKEEGRELVFKGALKKRGGGQGDGGELLVFLFDHALLMVKQKTKHEQYKVYRRPIPLELLLVSAPDDFGATVKPQGKGKQQLAKKNSFNKNGPNPPALPFKVDAKGGFALTFVHLGRKYYTQTLWASTYVSQRKWVENIAKQQDVMRERSSVFDTVTLSEGFFVGLNKVNCAAPFNAGKRFVFGTDDGVYMSNLETVQDPVKVLALLDVSQIDVLEEYQLLLVLSERQVITFPLDALDPNDPMAGLKRAKRISSHTSFFKAGVCLGKTLVCVVKASPLSSTIKTLEPIDQNVRGRSKPTFRKLLQGGHDTLRVFKASDEFYIPVESSSIHFLKTKLCVGCTKGFEIVDLESLDTQGLLDPADESLEFVLKRENLKPMAIYRIDNEFLLCYDEFAFYVNKNGWRSRKNFMVHWEGVPTGFALRYPYVLAFEPTFVEIRHVETGSMAQVIQGNNLRCLFADTPPSATNTSSQFHYNPYPGHGYDPYGNPYGSRQSIGSIHSGSPNPYSPYPSPYSQRFQATGRDEILMVSDDRVMAVRMAGPSLSDSASMASVPR